MLVAQEFARSVVTFVKRRLPVISWSCKLSDALFMAMSFLDGADGWHAGSDCPVWLWGCK